MTAAEVVRPPDRASDVNETPPSPEPGSPGAGRAAASRLVPATGLPLLYFAFAHFCLALGFAALVASPGLPAGFFHHPRMVALVHLVTLGWITSSILGAFYIVGPLALRMPLPAGTSDRLAFAGYAGGVAVARETARGASLREHARRQRFRHRTSGSTGYSAGSPGHPCRPPSRTPTWRRSAGP